VLLELEEQAQCARFEPGERGARAALLLVKVVEV
jgi:hypothetical protein